MAVTSQDLIFASTVGSTYVTKDAGLSYRAVGPGAYNIFVDQHDKLYVLTLEGKIVSSSDGGNSFQYNGKEPGDPSYAGLGTIKKLPNGDLLVFTGPAVNPIEVFVSSDDGQTWTFRHAFQSIAQGQILVMDSTVFVCNQQDGIWRSDDGGLSFQLKNVGILDGDRPEVVYMTCSLEGKLYCLTHHKVYYSDDKGDNWHDISANLPDIVFGKLIVNSNNQLLYLDQVSLKTWLRQEDGQWLVSSEYLPARLIPGDAFNTNSGLFLYGPNGGIQKCTIDGSHWSSADGDIPVSQFRGIAIGGDSSVIVGYELGIAKIKNGKSVTSKVTTDGLELYPYIFFGLNPSAISTTHFITRDNGDSWQLLPSDIQAIDSLGNFFRMTDDWNGVGISTNIEASYDKGEHWGRVVIANFPSTFYHSGICAAGARLIVAGTDPLFADYQLWEIDPVGKSAKKLYSSSSAFFDVGYRNGSIFLRAYEDLRRSDDHGNTWKSIFSTAIGFGTIGPNFSLTGSILWVGDYLGHIAYSIDKGDHWQAVNAARNAIRPVAANFAVDHQGYAYIAINNYGVVKSTSQMFDKEYLDPAELPTATTTGIDHVTNQIMAYPNPVRDKLVVQLPENNMEKFIEIYSVSGNLLSQRVSILSEEVFTVNDFSSGLYFVKIRVGSGIHWLKIIKLL